MVVEARVVEPRAAEASRAPVRSLAELDLGYLCLFLGMRVNELVTRRGKTAGFADLRQSHGYVVQHLIESSRTITELARRMEVTQQAASKSVAELIRLGVLEAEPGEDRRERRIRLSERGWQAVRTARRHRREIERRLLRALGAARYQRAKSILIEALEALGGAGRIRTRRVRQPL
jgi:DNA-binding MarR family transcriptional regulator